MGNVFDTISRFFESGKSKSRSQQKSRRPKEEYSGFERDQKDFERIKSNVIRELGKENEGLMNKVSELKEQTAKLQDLLQWKDTEEKELKMSIENIKTEATKTVELDKKQLDQMSNQITGQISVLSDKLEAQFGQLEIKIDAQGNQDNRNNTDLEEKLTEVLNKGIETIDEKLDKNLSESLEKCDEMTNIISENVHNESVKCFRNIQATLDEIDEKLTVIENKKTSHTGLTALVVITMLVSMGNLALIALMILGIVK